jgi:hypothetical protein
MTLIELLVAMAIIAVVAIMCASAFATILGSEMRETNTRLASEKAEERIAAGDAPSYTTDAAISIGGFEIPSTADTYSETAGEGDTIAGEKGRIDISGKRGYTVLKGAPSPLPKPMLVGYFDDENSRLEFQQKGFNAIQAPEDSVAYTISFPGNYRLEVWGAAGGALDSDLAYNGLGGYAAGTITLDTDTTLYLYAGGMGKADDSRKSGGFNGGGNGAQARRTGGGGASDIRIDGETLYHRVIVAGGGGGTITHESYTYKGGAGGGLNGIAGYTNNSSNITGTGGTQIAVGTRSNTIAGYILPSFGSGGSYNTGGDFAGGGGGWYGGCHANPAGGGSGWVYTQTALDYWKTNKTGTQGDSGDYALGPEYELTDTSLIDGEHSMPNPLSIKLSSTVFDSTDPSTWNRDSMTGNSSGGFICITYLG